jgi:hypothetical protein
MDLRLDDGDMRMLGVCDGTVHALIDVQNEIARYAGRYARRINPRHVHKIAERDRILAPLRRLEEHLGKQLELCQRAYQETRIAA